MGCRMPNLPLKPVVQTFSLQDLHQIQLTFGQLLGEDKAFLKEGGGLKSFGDFEKKEVLWQYMSVYIYIYT